MAGVIGNIIDMVRGFHDRAQAHAVDEQLKNYINDPEGTIQAVMQKDPRFGIALQEKNIADTAAAAKARRENSAAELSTVGQLLRGLPEGADVAGTIDKMSPYLVQNLGLTPDHIGALKTMAATNPQAFRFMDDKAWEAFIHDKYTSTVATPGAHVIRGGQVIDKVPFAARTINTAPGNVSTVFDPNTGQFVTAPPAAGPQRGATPVGPSPTGNWTVDDLLPHFVGQESSGSYTAKNTATGALGKYQVMPKTGAALAARLGMVWNPNMMVSDSVAGRRYQDAIGRAAIQEAINNGGGKLDDITGYYYGGSDRRNWGPKTAAYQMAMRDRVTGGGNPAEATITPTSVSVPPKPPKPGKSYRAATPQELAQAGYPAGSAAQIDQDGKLVNLHLPTSGKGSKALTPEQAYESYQSSVTALDDLLGDIRKLRHDPQLSANVGTVSGLLSHVLPGTHRKYLNGLVESINAQKMVSLVQALKQGGGNPFNRITNMEAQQLPKTLGNFDLNQNATDLVSNLDKAEQRLMRMRQQLVEGAKRQGILNPPAQPAAPAATGGRPSLQQIFGR